MWLKMVPLNSRVDFQLVFNSNYRRTTHRFQDITTGRTTEDRRTDDGKQRIYMTFNAGQQLVEPGTANLAPHTAYDSSAKSELIAGCCHQRTTTEACIRPHRWYKFYDIFK